jgi:flagellar basal-body rod modification protein FlgD
MTTSTSSVTQASALTGTASTTKTPASEATASQDRFLKLLVAQLNNQDPMNPMDNAQMTSQMAQINTVTGIQQLNETVKSLSAQFTSMQVLQGASMVGRGVMLQGNTLSIEAGQAQGAVDLAGNADTVSIQIVSPGGQLVDTVNLGALSAGRHDFTWDASAYQGTGNPSFKVVATQGGSAVSSTSFARDTVTSVGTDNGAMTVQLKGRAAVAYADIAAIL